MRTTVLALASILSAIAVPAAAAWERIASIDLSGRNAHEFSMQDFTGNVIGLTARDSDVRCDRVAAVFANGDSRPLFRGELPKGLSVRVDLPPGTVDRVTFNCHSVHGRAGAVDLAADTGAPEMSSNSRG